MGGQADALVRQRQAFGIMGNRPGPAAMNRVELFQQGVLFRLSNRIIDQNYFAACPGVDQVTQGKFANPATAVEGDTGHLGTSKPIKVVLQGDFLQRS